MQVNFGGTNDPLDPRDAAVFATHMRKLADTADHAAATLQSIAVGDAMAFNAQQLRDRWVVEMRALANRVAFAGDPNSGIAMTMGEAVQHLNRVGALSALVLSEVASNKKDVIQRSEILALDIEELAIDASKLVIFFESGGTSGSFLGPLVDAYNSLRLIYPGLPPLGFPPQGSYWGSNGQPIPVNPPPSGNGGGGGGGTNTTTGIPGPAGATGAEGGSGWAIAAALIAGVAVVIAVSRR